MRLLDLEEEFDHLQHSNKVVAKQEEGTCADHPLNPIICSVKSWLEKYLADGSILQVYIFVS